MSQGAYVTLVGYVAQEPRMRSTSTGKVITDLRVGISPRFRDRATGEWRDAEPSYFTVSCWERLAHHVRASMHKGDPVLVKGRFRTESYEDKDGRPRTETRITAETVGHDLNRGIATYMRQQPRPPVQETDPAGDQAPGSPDPGEGPDEMIDEDAIERFGRDLDDGDVAARALAEDQDGDDDAADTAAPPVPSAPF
jgi:single-strand DNA-binding protein